MAEEAKASRRGKAVRETEPVEGSGGNGGKPLTNAVKIAGELAVVPGLSLFLDGKIVAGAVHAVVGIAARAAFGVPGLICVAANSYAKSVTGRHLHQQFGRKSTG